MCYPSRKGKNETKGESEILKLPRLPQTRGRGCFLLPDGGGPDGSFNMGGRRGPAGQKGLGVLLSPERDGATPVGLDGRVLNQRGLFSSLKI